jgi:uncharacterized membrane protein YvbJ
MSDHCPKCHADVTERDETCPQCGIYFRKWQERETNLATGNVTRYQALAKATSNEFNWTILVIICIVIAGIFYFLGHKAALE